MQTFKEWPNSQFQQIRLWLTFLWWMIRRQFRVLAFCWTCRVELIALMQKQCSCILNDRVTWWNVLAVVDEFTDSCSLRVMRRSSMQKWRKPRGLSYDESSQSGVRWQWRSQSRKTTQKSGIVLQQVYIQRRSSMLEDNTTRVLIWVSKIHWVLNCKEPLLLLAQKRFEISIQCLLSLFIQVETISSFKTRK